MRVNFIVPGEARGKGRPRFARRGNFVKTYTDDKTLSYENLVKHYSSLVMVGQKPIGECCSVSIDVSVGIPASWSNKKKAQAAAGEVKPTGKPDLDNIAKAILDAMNGIVFDDDKQVVVLLVGKRYSEKPQTIVSVKWGQE